YLPRGWWHVARPMNQPSLHLTVGITPLHGLNMMNWAIERMRALPVMRQDLPSLKDSDEKAAHMARLRAAVADILSDGAIDDFLRDASDHVRGRPHIRLPNAPYVQTAPLKPSSRIRLAASHVLTFMTDGEKVTFRAYGASHTVPSRLRPALAMLSDTSAPSLSELAAVTSDSDALVQVLEMMARVGIVLVEPG